MFHPIPLGHHNSPGWGDTRVTTSSRTMDSRPSRNMQTGTWHMDNRHHIRDKRERRVVNVKRLWNRRVTWINIKMELKVMQKTADGINHMNQRNHVQSMQRGNRAKGNTINLTHGMEITVSKGYDVIIQGHYYFPHVNSLAVDSKIHAMKKLIQGSYLTIMNKRVDHLFIGLPLCILLTIQHLSVLIFKLLQVHILKLPGFTLAMASLSHHISASQPLSLSLAQSPLLLFRRHPNPLPQELKSLLKVEKMARQAALHYLQTTTPLQQELVQAIESKIRTAPLSYWSSKNFPWEPEHFSTYTAATKYAQMVELYWHVRSFMVQGVEQSPNLHHQQTQPQHQHQIATEVPWPISGSWRITCPIFRLN